MNYRGTEKLMNERHEAEIANALEHLDTYGWVHIRRDLLLKHWYGKLGSCNSVPQDVLIDLAARLPKNRIAEDFEVFEWLDDLLLIERKHLKKFAQ